MSAFRSPARARLVPLWVAAALCPAAVAVAQIQNPADVGVSTADPAGATNPIVGTVPFWEAWVQPCSGDDCTALVGCPDKPFLTIQAAINAVALNASADTPGIVHLSPGVYDRDNADGPAPCTSGASQFPIRLQPFVSLQGAGAKECIIRGSTIGEEPPKVSDVFFPVDSAGDCSCGVRVAAEVLVDAADLFSATSDFEVFVDGVTFQGGDVQLRLQGEDDVRLRVSNCVFDMLDYASHEEVTSFGSQPVDFVRGPYFGILAVNRFIFVDGGHYWDFKVNVIGNTFIQGWNFLESDHQSQVVTRGVASRPESVAICDVNDPVCPGEDSDQRLRGVGNLNVANNLIRHIDAAPRMPMLGIDGLDTVIVFGTQGGPTNAFDDSMYGPQTAQWTLDAAAGPDFVFCVHRSSPPVAKLNPSPSVGGVDPAFVGEMLANLQGVSRVGARDWRLLPSSALVDQGAGPAVNLLDPSGPLVLMAANLTTYTEPILAPTTPNLFALSSFDFDGEGYGNVRLLGAHPDIGFDEAGQLVHAGYLNDMRAFDVNFWNQCEFVSDVALQEFRVTPSAGSIVPMRISSPLFLTSSVLGYGGPRKCGSTGGANFAFSTPFGSAFPQFLPGLGLLWLHVGAPASYQYTFSFMPSLPTSVPSTIYTPLGDTLVHTFGLVSSPTVVETGSNFFGRFRCDQVLFTPSCGTAPCASPLLSNMQSFVSRR